MKNFLFALAMCLLPLQLLAQFNLSGRVTDSTTGNSLPGATILLENTSLGTTSGADGAFAFTNLAAGNYSLKVSFLGFEQKKVTINLQKNEQVQLALTPQTFKADEVVVLSTRADERTGTTYTNVTREAIEERNFGQDLPYLLENTPAVVVNSDAGAGVGYTGIRIRGSDISRINVTINGIPVNDSESHGVFFVNMPDFASSIEDIQVQRGVGTSTNGAGAFGASINIQTQRVRPEAYAETDHSYGSFDTWKNNLRFGTGLINGKFAFDGRLSRLKSDGYIDRAFSDLKSFYFSGGYYGDKTMLKFVTFSGKEKTYQAWDGVPEELLKTNRTYNGIGSYTDENGEEQFYENETDNYQQDHYQLHFAQDLLPRLNLGGALHFTRGRGYYEQYKENQKLSNYGLTPVTIGTETISRTDLIRQKWLDNYFYGATYALNYSTIGNKLNATVGGAWNKYDGDHYGEVIWARYASASEIGHRYYYNKAIKTDFNVFAKTNYQLTDKLGLFGDLQYRTINYKLNGVDDDNRNVTQQADFNFLNPKAGVTYSLSEKQLLYASYAIGNREPSRSDFTDHKRQGPEENVQPKHETLYNLETGYKLHGATTLLGHEASYSFDATYYYMDYNNQLVPTGELNDVGSPLRTNIKDSYRTGLELAGALNLNNVVEVSSNVAFSRNKIRNFTEMLYVYDGDYNVEDVLKTTLSETDIAFSPAIVSAHKLEVQPVKGLKAAVLYKTVGKQYLDNTSSDDRKIDAYQVMDLRLRYTIKPGFMKELEFALLVNNLLNKKYVANGYTWTELYSGDQNRYDYNYYYPQATRNFLFSVGMKF
ncbi:TonB-dependent receptor [Pontibacter sp. Tf4]|uniref:TonB-dependent receptor n=1 Tax=Pontibacter sp. Tf4 TaxID=2761620 RepID=UPI0016249C33|nr:TonB-dependent receptor [Pontibacter sp. Tf4]MBB6611280.1 TonB-dependent receptor [Pontibacter sp. Tf4]